MTGKIIIYNTVNKYLYWICQMSKQITIWTTKNRKESNVDYKLLKNVIIMVRIIHYFTHFSHEYHGEKWFLGVKNAFVSTMNCSFISQQLVIMYRIRSSSRGFSWRWLVGISLVSVGVSCFKAAGERLDHQYSFI